MKTICNERVNLRTINLRRLPVRLSFSSGEPVYGGRYITSDGFFYKTSDGKYYSVKA